MRPGHAEGAASQRPLTSTHTPTTANYGTAGRSPATLSAVARPVVVTARSGSTRVTMTYRCPACQAHHACTTGTLAPVTQRQTACGAGVIALHTGAVQVAA